MKIPISLVEQGAGTQFVTAYRAWEKGRNDLCGEIAICGVVGWLLSAIFIVCSYDLGGMTPFFVILATIPWMIITIGITTLLAPASLSDLFERRSLPGADFLEANLARVSLAGADLSKANFGGADLRGASFRGAKLQGTHFTDADLRGTDFTEADIRGAQGLQDAALRGALGLGGCTNKNEP